MTQYFIFFYTQKIKNKIKYKITRFIKYIYRRSSFYVMTKLLLHTGCNLLTPLTTSVP